MPAHLHQACRRLFIKTAWNNSVYLTRNTSYLCSLCHGSLLASKRISTPNCKQTVKYGSENVFGLQKLCSTNKVNYAAMSTDTYQQRDHQEDKTVVIQGKDYPTDKWTNLSPKILSYVGRNLHLQKDHPLCWIREEIVNHFYTTYMKSTRTPLFAVFDNFSPVVSTYQNFDSMLVPKSHFSRSRSDNYYINESTLLRAHTSAHEHELLKSGLDAFIVVGDVYRRDTIDSTHFPVFHQMECARLFNQQQLFANSHDIYNDLTIFEKGELNEDKQACHTMEAAKLVEMNLKKTLEELVCKLFGENVVYRWVDAYFPFTHPSFEMKIFFDGKWIEMLGCGILEQEILNSAGAKDSIGWAFGLGLERLAMRLFNIPDIRYFWSKEEAVLSQFRNYKNIKDILFKPLLSNQPAVENDISFWVPKDFCANDFYDLIRNLDSSIVETVTQVDSFVDPKTGRESHCYRIFYRHTDRPLSQNEVHELHKSIQNAAVKKLNVVGRW